MNNFTIYLSNKRPRARSASSRSFRAIQETVRSSLFASSQISSYMVSSILTVKSMSFFIKDIDEQNELTIKVNNVYTWLMNGEGRDETD